VFPRRFTFVIAFLVISPSLCAARDLAVVSNKGNAISGLTQAELIKLSKGEMARWPDGRPTTFVLRPPSTPEMKVLLEKIYEASPAQVSELISTANHGRANHPAIVIADSDEDLVNKVASLPGAVGIVDVYAINSSVTVVKVAGKLPLEPGYLLHGN
jgi:ABC-type phosphate transport system substrate-binding protein